MRLDRPRAFRDWHWTGKKDIDKAKTAKGLLTGALKFDEVKTHFNLSKSQVVEKMDTL